jgi:hypothetical protein
MRTYRTFVIVATLVGSLGLAPAALAAGKAPGGHGVFPLTEQDDVAITDLVCDDETITEVHTVRGGLAAWVPGVPDRMYVLTSVVGETTVTTPEGPETYPFAQRYGRKAGRSTTVACSMNFSFGGGAATGFMDITMVQIW